MKNIFPLFSLLIVLISTSCRDTNESFPAIRRIVNETSYNINIKVFSDIGAQFQYELAANDTLDIQGKCYCCVPKYCKLDWDNSLPNGEITFDNKRVQRSENDFSCPTKAINANPSDSCNGYTSTFAKENGFIIYVYRITQEDYDNAELIDGQ